MQYTGVRKLMRFENAFSISTLQLSILYFKSLVSYNDVPHVL